MEPDYSKYSLGDLRDVAGRINKDAYPERFQRVTQELQIREAEVAKRRIEQDTEPVPFSNLLRLVAASEVVIGILGLAALPWLFSAFPSNPRVWNALFGIAPLCSVVAGILLWRRRPIGVTLSLGLLLLQIPYFRLGSNFLFLWFGLDFTIKRGWYLENKFGVLEIGINLVAIVLLSLLIGATRSEDSVK